MKNRLLFCYLSFITVVLIFGFKFIKDDDRIATVPYKFNLPDFFDIPPLSEENKMTYEGVALGRLLFYDPILSFDSTYSCSNCHKQYLGFTDGLELSVGYSGKHVSKNSMPLINLMWQEKFFWDGRKNSIEEQVITPIYDSIEMGNNTATLLKRLNNSKFYKAKFKNVFDINYIDTVMVSKVLAQFVKSLISSTSEMDALFGNFREIKSTGNPDQNKEIESDLVIMTHLFSEGINKQSNSTGELLNEKYNLSINAINALMNCIKCHDKSFFGGNTIMANNGLDLNSKELFKAPTFRNLVYTAPYMHDGRFKNIYQVIRHYNTSIQSNEVLSDLLKDKNGKPKRFNLSDAEVISLGNFLLSVKDTSFISNKNFSNPFIKE
jgi:cytochrome c peroxidase